MTGVAADAELNPLLLLQAATNVQRTDNTAQLINSLHLYNECAAGRCRWRELGKILEEQGYLYLPGVLSSSKENLQALCALVRQIKTRSQSIVLDVASHTPVASSARSSSSYDARAWRAVTDSVAMHRITIHHNVALQRLFGRLNAHTQSKHAIALPGMWLRVHGAGVDETPAQTDYLHFRSHFPAIFGLPFRPRWSLDEKKLCKEVSVSRLEAHICTGLYIVLFCQCIHVPSGFMCVLAELPAPSVV